jgi:hypothetical protein
MIGDEMIRSIAFLVCSTAILVGLSSASLSADSDYSKALELKKQIEQMTGGKGKAATEPTQGPPASNPLHLDAPMRKAGWWEFAAVGQSGTAIGKQNLCIGEASEKVYSAFDQITGEAMTGIPCTKRDFQQTAEGWAFETTCSPGNLPGMSDLTMNAKGTITGDLATQYEVHQTVTSAGNTMTGVIQAALKGPCPEGRKEGDLADESGNLLVNMIGP